MRNTITDEVAVLRDGVARALASSRAELDDHRDTINQNTNEIRANHEYLCELDAKIEKLSERVDELLMLIAPDRGVDFSSMKLSTQEQEVFLVLYLLEGPLTPEQVGRRLGLSKQLAAQYLYNLQLKGLPIIARNWNGELFYSLDLKFKDLQARKNILNISPQVAKRIASVISR